jgi:hypothetical protein
MEVESSPAGPHAATRFGRAVTHDNGGVLFCRATEPIGSLSREDVAVGAFQSANELLQGIQRHILLGYLQPMQDGGADPDFARELLIGEVSHSVNSQSRINNNPY